MIDRNKLELNFLIQDNTQLRIALAQSNIELQKCEDTTSSLLLEVAKIQGGVK